MTDQMLMGPLADTAVPPGKRMSNSTYLALACANAVSQGSMTRKFRAIFEQQPAKDPPPLLSRAQVQQAIHESRMRRNSIACSSPSSPSSPQPPAPSSTEWTDPTTPTKPVQQPSMTATGRPGLKGCVSPGDNVGRHLKPWTSPTDNHSGDYFARPSTPTRSKSYTSPSSPSSVAGEVRCDKCLSILPSPPVSPVPPAPQQPKQQQKPVQQQPIQQVQQPIQPVQEEEKKLAVVPPNREVNEEELPKPDTVKNARCLFESSLVVDGYSTLQHVKSNPSSKILRSESTMTLDRAGSRHQQPYRWPARSETGSVRNRSPSPSLSTSPLPTAPFKTSKSSVGPAFYYRSTPSLYQNRPPPQQQRPAARQHNARHSRHSRHSTDVESYVSESECWSSDLESEVGSCGTSSHSSGRDHDQADMDGMRYIAPDVMEKIRSYGMTLTFVNGKMVDEDAEEEDDDEEEDAGQNYKATQKVVQSIRSAGQSQPTTKTTTTKTAAQPAPSPFKKVGPKVAPKQQQQPARIVACVPKSSSDRKRHSSGESSASSGVSSADSSPSPFASLKRTAASTAIHNQQGHYEEDRCPSPDLLSKDARKSQGSSPFGSYSVVYQFASGKNNNKMQHHRSPMYV